MKLDIECDAQEGENSRQKHRQIALAASSLFIEKGYHQTSMRQIAREVGMPMSSLYHYIRSKDDILFLVYGELYDVWIEELGKLKLEEIDGAAEKLRRLTRSMLQTSYRYKNLIQMTFRETKFLESDALKKILFTESQFIEVWIEVIKQGVEEGVFIEVDPNIIGNFVAYNTFFYPLRSWYFNDTVSYEEVEKQIVEFTLSGILIQPKQS